MPIAEFEANFGLSLTRIGTVRESDSRAAHLVGARVDPARGHDHFS
jgi:hypothetical protein